MTSLASLLFVLRAFKVVRVSWPPAPRRYDTYRVACCNSSRYFPQTFVIPTGQ